ncbi:MAG: hypothetical protein HQL08_07530 [Nitrospirae bacterium]|nr:hypothetical protein [Nitrospirota bacterium]
MKRKLKILFIAIFSLQVALMLLWFNISKPRLLILHSYHEEYSWVRDINVGLNRVLKNKSYFSIRWHYLDTKRHPWPEYKNSVGILARRMIDEWQPKVIIAMDDDAQEYVTKYYINKPGVSIVFGGVNNEIEDYGFDKANNVTGILERLPLDAVKEGLMTFSSGKTGGSPIRVFFIGDTSETVEGDYKWVKTFKWDPLRFAGAKLVDTLDEWKTTIKQASQSSDYILTSNYRRIYRNKGGKDLVPPKELLDETVSMSKTPVIGTNAFFAEDGGMLAIATSPLEQGEVAAKMAVDIIDNHRTAKHIPIVQTSQAVISINESRMKAFGFKVPMVYESCARAANYFFK